MRRRSKRMSSPKVDPVRTLESYLEKSIEHIDDILDKTDAGAQFVMVGNLLETALYILTGQVIDDELEEEAVLPEQKPRRNLREEMAGGFPEGAQSPINRPRRPARDGAVDLRDSHGITGGDLSLYETRYNVNPDELCPECRGPAENHPPDEKAKVLNGQYPHILCDRTRVYTT
jgi:hypothetical protein